MKNVNDYDDQVIKFPTTCPSCRMHTEVCVVEIPNLKEVIIMSLNCDECGYKSNEVKGCGEISSHGTRTTLRAETTHDMSRVVVKSDTASLAIPEIDFVQEESGQGVACTTVEGLLVVDENI